MLALSTALIVLGSVFLAIILAFFALFASGGLVPLLRLAFLARWSLLAALALPGVLVGVRLAPNLLGNLLVLETAPQLFNVTWLSLFVALMVVATFRVTQLNATARFSDYGQLVDAYIESLGAHQRLGGLRARLGRIFRPNVDHGWVLRWPLVFSLGLALPVAILWSSHVKLGWRGLGALVAGTLFALLMAALLTAVHQTVLHPDLESPGLLPFERWDWMRWLHAQKLFPWTHQLACRLATWAQRLGPGYTERRVQSERLAPQLCLLPGHGQLLVYCTTILAAYLGSYWLGRSLGWVPGDDSWFPALFFLLVVVLGTGLFLAGLSFYLDYFRLPVTLAVILVSYLLASVYQSDHWYELRSAPELAEPLRLPGALAAWSRQAAAAPGQPALSSEPVPRQQTLVVVTAAGGGIQAAAWTAQVLMGLDERYGPEFCRSIGLMSGVSGGSVGLMYVLDRWGPPQAPFDVASRAEVKRLAAASSLEATGWGLAYPDFLRTVAPPLVGDRRLDRGWAIEQVWRSRLADPNLDLVKLSARMRKGELPSTIFNATLVESGQRLIISPVLLPQGSGAALPSATDGRHFLELYPGSNLSIATAARLSATFPYVSPICRPVPGEGAAHPNVDYHVADGGYVDNEGLFTVVDWLVRLLNHYQEQRQRPPFRRILVVRIQPFPTADGPPPANLRAGWWYAAWGPIDALQHVRVASQAERNSRALELLSTALAAGTWLDDATEFLPGAGDAPLPGVTKQRADVEQWATRWKDSFVEAGVELDSVRVVFTPPAGHENDIPLSWKLNAQQKAWLEDAWQSIVNGPSQGPRPLEILDHYFTKKL